MVNFDVSLQGMHGAGQRFERAAEALARASVPAAPVEAADSVSLSDEMVALLQARNDYKANVRAAQTADEMSRDLLDALR